MTILVTYCTIIDTKASCFLWYGKLLVCWPLDHSFHFNFHVCYAMPLKSILLSKIKGPTEIDFHGIAHVKVGVTVHQKMCAWWCQNLSGMLTLTNVTVLSQEQDGNNLFPILYKTILFLRLYGIKFSWVYYTI